MINESNSFKTNKNNKTDKELLKISEMINKLKIKSVYTWENERFHLFYKKTGFYKSDYHLLKFLLLQENINRDDISKFWFLVTGAKREKLNNPQYYSNLINYFPDNIPNIHENQICIDLERTFPKDTYFQNPDNLNSLKNILISYSRRNKTIGYNQGFNFIAAKILKQLDDEENSFWVYTQILEVYLPLNYYNDLIGVMADCSIFQMLLKSHHPDIYKVFEKNKLDMELSGIYLKWFISLFITSVDNSLSEVILNYFFLLGNKVLFLAGLAIFHILKSKLMNITSMEELYEIFELELPKINDEISKSVVLYYILVKKIYLNIEQDRMKYQNIVLKEIYSQYLQREEIRVSNKYNTSSSTSFSTKNQTRSNVTSSSINNAYFHNNYQPTNSQSEKICNTYWSICVHDESSNCPPNLLDFTVLKTGYSINIIENYYFDKCFKKDYIKSKTINYSLTTKNSYQEINNFNFKLTKPLSKENKFIKTSNSSSNLINNLNDLSNREELMFKSYMLLLIERSIHICTEKINPHICVISKVRNAQNKKRMSIYNKKYQPKEAKLSNSAAKIIIASVTRTSLDNNMDKDMIVKDSNELFTNNNIDLLYI